MRFVNDDFNSFVIFLFSGLAFVTTSILLIFYIYKILKKRKILPKSDKKAINSAGFLTLFSLSLTAIFPLLANHLKIVTSAKYVTSVGFDGDDRFCKLEPIYLFDDAGLYVIALTFVASPLIMWRKFGKEYIQKLLIFLPIYLYALYFFIIFPFNFLADRDLISQYELPKDITVDQIKGEPCWDYR